MVSVVDLRSLYHDASISKQLCVNCGGSTSCTFQGVEGHPYVMLHGVSERFRGDLIVVPIAVVLDADARRRVRRLGQLDDVRPRRRVR